MRPAECFDCCWVAGLYGSWPTPEENYVFLMRARPGPFYPAAWFGIATATCWFFRVCHWDGQRSEQRFYLFLRMWHDKGRGPWRFSRYVLIFDSWWRGRHLLWEGGIVMKIARWLFYYNFHAAVLCIVYYLINGFNYYFELKIFKNKKKLNKKKFRYNFLTCECLRSL